MMARHIDLGKTGEDHALDYLLREGYSILHRNWRFKHNEIDIIATDNNDLVVVEVKTRSTDLYGTPEESVDKKKQEFLIKATEALIEKYSYDMNVRYDIISVIINRNKISVNHIKDAFYPD